MKSALLITALVTIAHAVPAKQAGIQVVDANFDDIDGVNPFVGFPPPTPYKFLNYSNFALLAPVPNTITLQPSSRPNAVFSNYVNPVSPAFVTADYTDSNVVSFDLNSVNTGCVIGSRNGVFAPAVDCTIQFRGTTALTGAQVTQDFVFKTGSFFGVAQGPVTMQKAVLGPQFKGLRSFSMTITKAPFPATPGFNIQIGADNFEYVVLLK